MLYDCKRISYWIDRRLTDLAGPDYDATISFGLPLEPEDFQYGKSRIRALTEVRGHDAVHTSRTVSLCVVGGYLVERCRRGGERRVFSGHETESDNMSSR